MVLNDRMVAGSAYVPTPESGIEDCIGAVPQTWQVEDCVVDAFDTGFFMGAHADGGFAIWDADVRGAPIERFPGSDDGFETARFRLRELVERDPRTVELLAWYRGTRSRPF
jgi:hypothetical protein